MELVDVDATCAVYLQQRGDGVVHFWQICASNANGETESVAGTSRVVDGPVSADPSQCATNRREFFYTHLETIDLSVDVIELGDDEGDLADFFPSGEFTHQLCFFEWSWDYSSAEPLRRFW